VEHAIQQQLLPIPLFLVVPAAAVLDLIKALRQAVPERLVRVTLAVPACSVAVEAAVVALVLLVLTPLAMLAAMVAAVHLTLTQDHQSLMLVVVAVEATALRLGLVVPAAAVLVHREHQVLELLAPRILVVAVVDQKIAISQTVQVEQEAAVS